MKQVSRIHNSSILNSIFNIGNDTSDILIFVKYKVRSSEPKNNLFHQSKVEKITAHNVAPDVYIFFHT